MLRDLSDPVAKFWRSGCEVLAIRLRKFFRLRNFPVKACQIDSNWLSLFRKVPKMRTKARHREIKKNISLARSIFHKIYGEGSARDRELDMLLQKTTELMNESLELS